MHSYCLSELEMSNGLLAFGRVVILCNWMITRYGRNQNTTGRRIVVPSQNFSQCQRSISVTVAVNIPIAFLAVSIRFHVVYKRFLEFTRGGLRFALGFQTKFFYVRRLRFDVFRLQKATPWLCKITQSNTRDKISNFSVKFIARQTRTHTYTHTTRERAVFFSCKTAKSCIM